MSDRNSKIWHRHDLVEISEKGRRWAAEIWMGQRPESLYAHLTAQLIEKGHSGIDYPAASRQVSAGIQKDRGKPRGHRPAIKKIKLPGIIRRDENKVIKNALPVGFSSPFRVNGQRLRVAAFVPPQEVVSITSPCQVIQADFPPRTSCLEALWQIKSLALENHLRLGVWGSAALEIYTGLPYTDSGSDLDLLLKPAGLKTIQEFASEVFSIGSQYGCRVDIELDLPTGYGVNVREVMDGKSSILGKGLHDVVLIPRPDVLACCLDDVQ